MAGKAFLLYWDWFDAMEEMQIEDRDRWMLLSALVQYARTGEYPNLTEPLKFAFNLMRGQIERDNEKYQQRCEANRKNGQKGGRPPSKDNPFKEFEED